MVTIFSKIFICYKSCAFLFVLKKRTQTEKIKIKSSSQKGSSLFILNEKETPLSLI